jgi:hypothetical protein
MGLTAEQVDDAAPGALSAWAPPKWRGLLCSSPRRSSFLLGAKVRIDGGLALN